MRNKKNIFMLGDFESSNGPGIANHQLRADLRKSAESEFHYIYSKEKNRLYRIYEIFQNLKKSECVLIANYTRLHLLAVFLAKKWNKPVIYRLHGYQMMECQINGLAVNESRLRRVHKTEQYIFKNMALGICVSKMSRDYMKKKEPNYREKFDYCYNSIDLDGFQNIMHQQKKKEKRNMYRIISAGGGMRQKNNRIVAKAIQRLVQEGMKIQYCVIGTAYTDKEELCSYPFVKYYDVLTHEKVLKLMQQSDLYIQDSTFDTFGLSAVEALLAGCSVLLSENMGVLEILGSMQEEDVIRDVENDCVISEKIRYLLLHANRERQLEGMDREAVSGMRIVSGLEEMIRKILE